MLRKFVLLYLAGAFSTVSFAADLEVQFIGASTTELENPHDLKLSLDGKYLLCIGAPNFKLDAAPSKPIIYKIK